MYILKHVTVSFMRLYMIIAARLLAQLNYVLFDRAGKKVLELLVII